jgi:hypothetical protein
LICLEKGLDLSIWSSEKNTDNAQNFNGKMIVELCTKWKIKHSNSSSYRLKIPRHTGLLIKSSEVG